MVNNRNFGQIRSPFHALTLVESDATIMLCTDLKAYELIHDFFKKMGERSCKESSKENRILFAVRSLYYKSLSLINL